MYHTFAALITAACLLAGCHGGVLGEPWSPFAMDNAFPNWNKSVGLRGGSAVIVVVGP